ncbi:hypothetical protein HYALB_00005134 [Hymenoscyphus albidus]|uniref:Uncharacterized protein n=1 Tax=Hymenoscyphus albidus TaxID=595503 RepID=A0A9N9LWV3_9HELO|nr:hypothetical protein HYALB_00005134 [Hymenoscyphus albidus]
MSEQYVSDEEMDPRNSSPIPGSAYEDSGDDGKKSSRKTKSNAKSKSKIFPDKKSTGEKIVSVKLNGAEYINLSLRHIREAFQAGTNPTQSDFQFVQAFHGSVPKVVIQQRAFSA